MSNGCAMQHHAFGGYDDMRSSFAVPERKDPVLCPKPRRLTQLSGGAYPVKPLKSYDLRPGTDLLDILLSMGVGGEHQQNQAVESSPPFFCGSPPTRSANPLVHDSRFGEAMPLPVGDLMDPQRVTSSGATARKGCGPARAKFGLAPAAVRIEGFNCLDRDRRGIPAVA